MAKRSAKFRDLAQHAGEKARKAHSDDEGAMQRKRQDALNQLAGNEDWLDGDNPACDSAAERIAGTQLDEMRDPDASADENARRKKRLIKGPEEFRTMRKKPPK